MAQEKQRIIQEFVPGKQVTLAHVIANPEPDLFKKLGVIGECRGAIGILTITPGEGAIIGADAASRRPMLILFLWTDLTARLSLTAMSQAWRRRFAMSWRCSQIF